MFVTKIVLHDEKTMEKMSGNPSRLKTITSFKNIPFPSAKLIGQFIKRANCIIFNS